MKSAILNFFKVVMPLLMQQLVTLAAKNIGGFRLWLVKKILGYGGRALIDAINEGIRQHDRDLAQQKAKEELEKVKNDPSSTPEQVGEAYEKYFNAGRK